VKIYETGRNGLAAGVDPGPYASVQIFVCECGFADEHDGLIHDDDIRVNRFIAESVEDGTVLDQEIDRIVIRKEPFGGIAGRQCRQ
jgi:hypothetical protein